MINHVSIGVSDISQARLFYDAVLKPLGYACLSNSKTSLGYGKGRV
ncbi:lactoylglutathione lyase protein, partial [mine drainage metagenome]